MTASQNSSGNGRFDGQTILVVGAGSGIGRSVSLLCAQQGGFLVLADCDLEKARETQVLLQSSVTDSLSSILDLNVTEPDSWNRAMEHIEELERPLDIMIQTAGIADQGGVVELSLDQWRRVMAVNLDGAFLGTSAALKLMISQGFGSIVHVSSLAGIKAFPGAAAYGVSKAGLIHLTRVAATECGQTGQPIRVNCVVPGGVKTPMWETTPMWPAIADSDEWMQGQDAAPAKRFAEPEEIARAILFLASRDASYVNGEAFMVDGGGGL